MDPHTCFATFLMVARTKVGVCQASLHTVFTRQQANTFRGIQSLFVASGENVNVPDRPIFKDIMKDFYGKYFEKNAVWIFFI